MTLVVDASVVVKWLFPDPKLEPHADRTLELVRAFGEGQVELLQPVHWLAEAAAVVTRLQPEVAARAIALLYALELPVADDPDITRRASRLASELQHHLFDTLYHAVAIERGATLVSADTQYVVKAQTLGHLVPLAELRLG